MNKTTLYKNGFPSTLRLIIYIIIISAVCFLSCLLSDAQEEPSPVENISWTILSE